MSDPRRLVESASPFEMELLKAGRSDAMSPQSRNAILASLGVGLAAPAVLGGALAEAHAATGAASREASQLAAEGAVVGQVGEAAVVGEVALGKAALGKVALGKVALGKGLVSLLGGGLVGVTAMWGLSEDTKPSQPQPVVEETVQWDAPSPPKQPAETAAVDSVGAQNQAGPDAVSPHTTRKPSRARTGMKSKIDAEQKSVAHSSAPSGPSLADELALLDSARKALRQGQSSAALNQLQRYRARYPKGRLRAEASVLHIEILTAQGKRTAATKVGESFLRRSPSSPYGKRVRSLIGDKD